MIINPAKKRRKSFPIIGILILFMNSCSSEKEKITITPVQNNAEISLSSNTLPEEYMREGFINRDTFRVVIVTPRRTTDEGIASIESQARIRAVSALKNYIQNQGWDFTDRTRGELFRLIISNGSVSHMERNSSRDSVYVYDIRKGNIQNEIDFIATRR